MIAKPSVALIGAGAMGGSLLKGWIARGAIDAAGSAVFDPGAREEVKSLCRENGLALNPPIGAKRVDALVIAVKPQIADAALPAFAPLAKDALVVSVMAGRTVASVATALGGAKKIARAMPNLPASIGKGVAGLYASRALSKGERAMVETLIGVAGATVWVETETQIDLVTAVSGSGPAYVFLLAEALADAGAALGLSRPLAEKLARATLVGAGALLEADSCSAAELRRAVTSPGGTTEAALKILDGDEKALRKLMKAAVEAAARRAGELTE
jgi:pyrroline-5-carboxylate reductase